MTGSKNQELFFKSAKWVGASERGAKMFYALHGKFEINSFKKASLRVLGLGFFKCYINGVCINPDTFLPLSSDYEAKNEPCDEVLSGHRVYVPFFDITPFVKDGENDIVIHFGGGWYTHHCRLFGLPKAIYCISVEEMDKTEFFVSDESCKIRQDFVENYNFTSKECHNYLDFDNGLWDDVAVVEGLDTEYCETDCPIDTLIEELPVKAVGRSERGVVYDCGKNTSGYPVLKLDVKKGEQIRVLFSEELLDNGTLDMTHSHNQEFSVISDGTPRIVQPEFTWYGFRYFEVIGKAEPLCVKVVHANVDVSSSFDSDNETLNWIYKTFINTMLSNMHTGHPSDCPHVERRGYTGDGRLTCHAALSVFDARAFYEKWLQDIADGQDTLSGHVQYAAPYVRCGGGPGGWGSAIVEVPYRLYKHYGDKQILTRYYENMRRYIDYLEEHSEFGLVTSDKEGAWCLGDWCGPNVLYPDKNILYHDQQVFLPAPMVNTYFMVKSLKSMCEIARIIGKDEDVAEYEKAAEIRSKAIKAAYFNAFDGNFIMNVQGANAFAVDIGLGNKSTYSNMTEYYRKTGCFDTGIFATDILSRVLFENGDGELAVDLITGNGVQGFEHWRQNGATTFHEYWDSNRSRSHNHPMFGAVVAYFFEYLLGIRQANGSAGYSNLIIKPCATAKFNYMSGSINTPNGRISVGYKKQGDKIHFNIDIPKNTTATFIYDDKKFLLCQGLNELCL